jgi:hypothetical protein
MIFFEIHPAAPTVVLPVDNLQQNVFAHIDEVYVGDPGSNQPPPPPR